MKEEIEKLIEYYSNRIKWLEEANKTASPLARTSNLVSIAVRKNVIQDLKRIVDKTKHENYKRTPSF